MHTPAHTCTCTVISNLWEQAFFSLNCEISPQQPWNEREKSALIGCETRGTRPSLACSQPLCAKPAKLVCFTRYKPHRFIYLPFFKEKSPPIVSFAHQTLFRSSNLSSSDGEKKRTHTHARTGRRMSAYCIYIYICGHMQGQPLEGFASRWRSLSVQQIEGSSQSLNN